MTNSFRKHHKTIMWIIIVGTIVSFVYFLSPTARNGGGGGSSRPVISHGSINGETITQPQFDEAMQETRMFFRFNQGHWPSAREEESQAMTNTAYQRLFIQSELKKLNLEVTPEAAARYTRMMFGLPAGAPFPQDKFNDFVKTVLIQQGHVGLDDFDRFVRGQVGQELLLSLFGMTGQLISQKEAEFFFRRDNETMGVELVRFPVTNYMAKVSFTPQDIADFYQKDQATYRLPDREQINYIRFDVSNYFTVASNILAGMTNLEAQLEMTYENSDPATFKDDTGAQLTPEAAKVKIKESYQRQLAAKSAQTNVMDLANRLLDGHSKDKPVTKEDLQKLAASNGLEVVTSAPFDQQHPPQDLALAPSYLPFLFQLEFGDPTDQYKIVQGTNGFCIVGLEKKFPSEDQPLETVRAKVEEDYRTEKAMDMIKNAGAAFENAVRTGLAKGQSFDVICASQGLKPEILTPFAAVTPSIPEMTDKQEFEYLVRIVYELPTGQCSPFSPTPSGGFLAYVQSRTPVDEAIVQRDIAAFLDRFRRQRMEAAYQEWMMREFQAHVVMAQAPTG